MPGFFYKVCFLRSCLSKDNCGEDSESEEWKLRVLISVFEVSGSPISKLSQCWPGYEKQTPFRGWEIKCMTYFPGYYSSSKSVSPGTWFYATLLFCLKNRRVSRSTPFTHSPGFIEQRPSVTSGLYCHASLRLTQEYCWTHNFRCFLGIRRKIMLIRCHCHGHVRPESLNTVGSRISPFSRLCRIYTYQF